MRRSSTKSSLISSKPVFQLRFGLTGTNNKFLEVSLAEQARHASVLWEVSRGVEWPTSWWNYRADHSPSQLQR